MAKVSTLLWLYTDLKVITSDERAHDDWIVRAAYAAAQHRGVNLGVWRSKSTGQASRPQWSTVNRTTEVANRQ
jgi:hypothetical protein